MSFDLNEIDVCLIDSYSVFKDRFRTFLSPKH